MAVDTWWTAVTDFNLLSEIEGYLSVHGQAIPQLPVKPRLNTYTIRLDAQLFEMAQVISNDRRLPYGHEPDALQRLIRHAVHLLVLALARKLKRQEAGPLQWELEILTKQSEDQQFAAFVAYAREQLSEAKMARDATAANDLIAQTYGSEGRLRRRMHEYLLGSKDLKAVAKKTRDEHLLSWMELAL